MTTVPTRPLIAAVMVTSGSVFPAFATGALGVQLRDELHFDEARLGVAAGVFFVAAILSTAALGRLGERLGPTIALRIGLTVTAAAELWLAWRAESFTDLLAPLLVAGVANSMSQPTANLFLSRTFPPETMGIATAVKQSGMPASALLGGLTVPALALTVGWQWVYVAGAIYALVAACVLPPTPRIQSVRQPAAKTDTPTRSLGIVAASISLCVAGASATTAWIVSSAEASGMAPGPAALLLSGGSLLGIFVRLGGGVQSDRTSIDPMRAVAIMVLIGVGGLLLLSIGTGWSHLLAIVPAFGAGWAWPGLFNLAIIRANPSAPGAATGITQTGIYVGNFAAPMLFGLLVDRAGYGTAWLATAAVASVGAAMLFANQHLQPAAARRT